MNMPFSDARMESIMFRINEITDKQKSLKEEKARLLAEGTRMLEQEGLSYYLTNLDENNDLKFRIKDGTEKVFEKDKMATDLGVAPSATTKKDFLINMTEQKKLTLQTFKRYFHYVPSKTSTLTTVKSKQSKKKK